MRVMSQNRANGSKICVMAIMITLVALRTRSKWKAVWIGVGFGLVLTTNETGLIKVSECMPPIHAEDHYTRPRLSLTRTTAADGNSG